MKDCEIMMNDKNCGRKISHLKINYESQAKASDKIATSP